ncbi:hypothetical protein [Atlantibacter hermannii]|uniref:hypothetical protein n=1 Tax=Atlantibacter hermannii TaxID=565 RepID=UPI00296E9675|nr:hypothetical protein [Atlantibacter hermannii]MDW4577475.1 hypothetical protein [Atlantibacter hermannii]
MKDIYLRFSNKEQMRQQLINSGFEESEGDLFHAGVCLDVVGVIYSQVNSDAENPEYTADDGWHVNIRIVDSGITLPELTPFIVEPKSPSRVWA